MIAPRSSKSARLTRGITVAALASLLAMGGVGSLSSCGQPQVIAVKEPKQCELQIVGLTVIASPLINPTDQGEARPVQLRIYQLKTDIRLQNATFDAIWKDDKKTLQDDLMKVDELPIYPDSRTEVKFERDPAALNVVGVALFRNHKGKSWYTSFELPPPPGKGACGLVAGCPDGNCGDAGPVFNPRFSLWIDQDRIDVGDEHLDDYPDGGRVQTVHLTGKSAAPAAPAAAPAGSP